jgi:hypothetical protein
MQACTKLTDIDPSPTADAQRFTEPLRTSPAANTPGRLVSRRNGARPAVRHRSASIVSGGRALPVRTKPRLSSADTEMAEDRVSLFICAVDDDEAEVAVSFGEEHLAGANCALASAPGERIELRLSESGKRDFRSLGMRE